MNEDANPSPAAIPSDSPTESVQSAGQSSTPASECPSTANPSPVKQGGRPKGIHTPLKTKKRYDPEELANDMAATLAKGHGILRAPTLRHISFEDKERLARAIQEPVEAFNERLASKLRITADKLADRIDQKVDEDAFKPGELGFIFSVMHDKRLSLDGSRALNNASVNIQVNNFGSSPKDQLLTELDGMTNVTPKTVTETVAGTLAGIVSPLRTEKVS